MLKNKNAVVTGATRGIGREIAFTLAKNGANVAINYRTLNEEVETIKTDTIPAINATIAGLGKVVKITQAAYDALATKDANTLYVIVG